MPMKRLLLATFGLLALLGCQSSDNPKLRPPTSTRTLALTPDERDVLEAMPVGAALKLILPPPQGGPGYTWEIVSNNNRVLWQTAVLKPNPDAKAGGTWSATFQAIRSGRSTLRFASIKSGQALSEPDDVFQVIVGAKLE
jgi:hypothetical protein